MRAAGSDRTPENLKTCRLLVWKYTVKRLAIDTWLLASCVELWLFAHIRKSLAGSVLAFAGFSMAGLSTLIC